jgi:Putative amidoligase enzyme
MAFSGWVVRKAEMTFGAEIECIVNARTLSSRGLSVGGYHHGFRVDGSNGFTESHPLFGFEIQHDGSLSTGGRVGCRGAEFVSPVLKGAEGIARLRRAVEYIKRELRGSVNSTTGLHVHVCPGVINGRTIKSIITNAVRHEEALYAVTGTQARKSSYYARPLATVTYSVYGGLVSAKDAVASIPDDAVGYALASALRSNVRYDHVNVQNLKAHAAGQGNKPTIEFRTFAGTLNPTKIAAYVQICLGIVEKGVLVKEPGAWEFTPLAGQVRKTPGCTAVAALFDHLGWTSIKSFYQFGLLEMDRIAELRDELRRLARKYDGIEPSAAE